MSRQPRIMNREQSSEQSPPSRKNRTLPSRSNYQQNVSQEPSNKWWAGEKPTTSEALAQMTMLTDTDPERGYEVQRRFVEQMQKPSSAYYNPFTQPTNPAVAQLHDLGFDVSNLDDAWFEQNSWLKQYYVTTDNTNNLSSTMTNKKASKEQRAAYAFNQLDKQREVTSKAQTESAALREELEYMAMDPNHNYSDDYITSHIDWKKYPTLAKMNETAALGTPMELNAPVEMATTDWMHGVLWAARNNGGTGSIWQDIGRSALGEGNQWTDDPEITAKLTWKGEDYSPFSVGMTAGEEGRYFGVYSFGEKEIQRLQDGLDPKTGEPLDPNDTTAMQMRSNVLGASETTNQAKRELGVFRSELDRKLEGVKDPEQAQKIVEDLLDREVYDKKTKESIKFDTLKKMDASMDASPNDLLKTTEAIDYRKQDMVDYALQKIQSNAEKLDANQTMEKNGAAPETSQTIETEKADTQKVVEAKDQLEGVATETELNVFSNTPSSWFDKAKQWAMEQKNDPTGLILKNEPETTSNYVSRLLPVMADLGENKKAKSELDNLDRANREIANKLDAIRDAFTSGAGGFEFMYDLEDGEYIEVGEGSYRPNSRYAQALVDLYNAATGQNVEYGDNEHILEDAKAFYDYIIDYRPTYEEDEEIPFLLPQFAERRTELEAEIERTAYAETVYNLSNIAWDVRIAAYEQAGLDSTGLKTAQAVANSMDFFADYEASEWNAYNAYDLMMRSEEGGATFEEVKDAAEQGDAQVQEELENAKFIRDFCEENGIEIPENYKKNLDRHIAKIEREKTDYEYFVIQGNDDFEEMAEKGREIDSHLPKTEQLDTVDQEGFSYGALMTDTEKNTYYYLLAKEGKDAAVRFWAHLNDPEYGVMSARSTEAIEESARQLADNNPIFANALAVLASPVEGLLGLSYMGLYGLTGMELNPKSGLLSVGKFSQTVNEETSKNIQEAIPEGPLRDLAMGAYEIAYNRFRSAANMLLGSPNIGGPLGDILNEIVGALPMAAGAGAMAIADAKEKGADDGTAYLIGGVTIAMESFTEGLTRSNIKSAFSGGGDGAAQFVADKCKEWLTTSGFEEAFGETLTDYVESYVDEHWLGVNSDHQGRLDKYIEENKLDPNNPLDMEKAEDAVRQEEMAGLLHTAIISYLSPGTEVAIASVKEGISDFHNIRVATRNMQKQGMNVSMSDVRKQYNSWKEQAREEQANAPKGSDQQTEDQQTEEQQTEEQQTADQSEETENPNFTTEDVDAEALFGNQEQTAQETGNSTNGERKLSEADQTFLSDLGSLDAVQNSDSSTQAAAIGAVFGGESGTQSGDMSSAAAANITNVFDTMSNAVQSIKNVLTGARLARIDQSQVKVAIQNAALSSSSEAARVVQSDEFKNASANQQAQMLADTVEADSQNETVAREEEKTIYENRIANAEKRLIADGMLDGVKNLQAEADKARRTVDMAQQSLEEKQGELQAKTDAMVAATFENNQNPTADNQHMVDRALNEVESASAVVQEYEQHLANVQKASQDAQTRLADGTAAAMKQIRQQAEATVAQENQQRAETAAQAAEQQRIADEQAAQAQAEEDKRSGKQAEVDTQKLAEDWANQMHLEGEERDAFIKRVVERQEQKALGKIDMTGKVSNAEGYLAINAFARKTGLNFQLSDTLPNGTRGMYENGTVYLNADLVRNGQMTVGQALVEASLHEVTHSMEDSKNYKTYRNVVLESMFGAKGTADELYAENAKYRAAVDQKIADYQKIGQELSVQKAEQEIVADFARLNLAEKETVQRFMDAGLGGKMRNTLHNINQAMKNFFGQLRGEDRTTAEYLRRAERAYQKALDDVAKTAVHPEGGQFSVAQIAQATGMTFDADTLKLYDQNGNEVDGVNNKITPDMIGNTPAGLLIRNGLSEETQGKAMDMMAGLMNMVARYKDSNLVWEIGATTLSSTFSALKSNSDPQYKTTVDFGTVCAKTQAIIDVMSKVMLDRVKEGKTGGLTRPEIMKVYNEVNKAGLSVPCPVCYVFSRWMGVPSLLGQMSQYQNDYVVTKKGADRNVLLDKNGNAVIDVKATQKLVDDYIKTAEDHYGDAKAINNAKTKLQNKNAALEEKRIELEGKLYDKSLTAEQKKDVQNQIDDVLAEQTENDKKLGEVRAYNWITQALCKKSGDKYVVDYTNGSESGFLLTPDEVLFDLNRTGDFAKYAKNWRYRNTRGAGMGKAIMPYSGESIGDILYGVKKNGRQNTIKNPWLNMNEKAAARQLREARNRAIKQNLVGGQRLQSTSDFRPEWGLDYIMSFLELQAAGSKVQMYTKVAEAVDFFASVGADVNLSIMGKGQGWHLDESGNPVLDFSSITGMDYETAKTLKDKYDNVQMILVGMNDTHIRLALANSDIDFVIPWHSSGNSKEVLSKLISTFKGEKLESSVDYTTTQTDMVKGTVKKYKDENGNTVEYTVPGAQTEGEKSLWDARMKLLTKGGDSLTQAERETLLSNPITKNLYERFTVKGKDPDCYGVKLSKEQANQIFPYEYWDTSLTKDRADENGKRFVEYCEAMGIVPRFSQFKDDPGYWKLLIDRPMYNNDGSYHQQSVINVTNAQIGELNESGELTGSSLPKQAQAKYAPKDPRNANYEKYTKAEQDAIENAKASIESSAKYDNGSEGQYSVYGDMTDSDIDQMLAQANQDYSDAVSRGDMEAAKEDMDFAAEQAGFDTDDIAFHGTEYFGFTEFGMEQSQGEIFVSFNNPTMSGTYMPGNTGNVREIRSSNIKALSNDQLIQKMLEISENEDQGIRSINYDDQTGTFIAEYDDGETESFTREELEESASAYLQYGEDLYTGKTTGEDSGDFEFEMSEMDKLAFNNYVNETRGIYRLYTRPGNQLVIDAEGANWDQIKVPWSDELLTTRQISAYAKENGYDSVRINNVVDHGGRSYATEREAGITDIGAFFNQNDVKSADPVTYDDNGNPIPLDQRFTDSPDLRYSAGGELTDADLDQMLAQADRDYSDAVFRGDMEEAQRIVDDAAMDAFPNSVLIQDGKFRKMWHHTNAKFTEFLPGTSPDPNGIKGIFFTPSEHGNISSSLGKNHKSYFLNVENLKFSSGVKADEEYADELRRRQEGVTDREEIARINREFSDETGVDAFFDWMNGWYTILKPENIKSADVVTYDENGNVIPLSERFNQQNRDFRYSTGGEITDADIDQRLAEAGIIPPAEPEMQYVNKVPEENTYRELEGQNPNLSISASGPQRAFGSANGMLAQSDEIDRRAKVYVMNQNGYVADSNPEQVDRAIQWIHSNKKFRNSDGFVESMEKVTGKDFDYRSADGQARMVALMGMAVARDDLMAQVQLADAFNRQGTDLGRALQARKLFRMMTPDGRISMLQKLLHNTEEETGIGNLNFSDWIYRAAASANEEGDFEKVYNAAAAELAEQIPATWKDKIVGWRMLSMLGNPRTHIRNFMGNAMFIPMVGLKNKIGALGEIAFRLKPGERTKTLGLANKESRDFAKRLVGRVESELRGEAKYNDQNAVKQAQKTWGTGKGIISRTLGKVLQGLSDFNSNALEWEDWVFLKGHFKRAFAGYMTANKYTAADMKGETLKKATEYAILEAHKATYRDANSVATALNNFAKRTKGTSLEKGAAAIQFAVNAVLPFKKTPANILKRGIEYSPAGLISAATDIKDMIQTVRHENNSNLPAPKRTVTPSQFIDKIASSLTGTGVMILGAVLGSLGAANAGFDDDDPEDRLKKLEGEQEYGVNFGKALNAITRSLAGVELFGEDCTRTMDWAAPFSMPFFVGVAVQKQLSKEHPDLAAGDIINAMLGITEPVFNLSMLDGVNSLFNVSQNDPMLPATQIGMKILLNYGSSFVPTLLGQAARIVDPTRRMAFVQSGKKPYQVFSTFESVQNKIPGASKLNIPYRNPYGEAEMNGSAAEVLFAPWYKKEIKGDAITKEIRSVFSTTTEVHDKIIPEVPPRYYQQGAGIEPYRLTDQEYNQVCITVGETGVNLLNELIQSDEYKMSSPDTKAMMMEDVWSYANKKGRQTVLPDTNLDTWMVNGEKTGNMVNAIVNKTIETKMKEYTEKRTTDLIHSLERGDKTDVQTIVTEMKDTLKINPETIRKYVSDYFRPMYYESDYDGREEIKKILYGLDIGYKKQTFSSWDSNADKEDEPEEEREDRNFWLNMEESEPETSGRFNPNTMFASAGGAPLGIRNRMTEQADNGGNPDSTGQYGAGNIDLNNRQVVQNEDGSISTERSFSFYDEDSGKEILVPTVINGRIVSEDEAIDHYYETGEYLGMFDTPEEADEYAERLHNRQDWYYNR